MERKLNISGSPVLGVFATCTDEFVFVPYETTEELMAELEEALGVKAIRTSVAGSSLIGSLMCGNSKGIITAGFIHEREIRAIRKHIKAARLSAELNAAGNLIVANDTAALVHPDISDKNIGIIEKTLGVVVKKGTIGGLKTVGMAASATNKGVLIHPKATNSEIAVLEELFGLSVDIGTVNFGSPLVGSGLLANSKGFVVGEETTGPEIGRIEDALGFN
ncbi:MAG: translation initiation factor IF-6 [Candidatus Methanoperedens sp.]|nr:translation initiation factor IF-6 [Candidatus Methanoperedens sp.]MCE8425255.1 translation initiation factor IF-6 [Candidatus Methanoperedens sp.]MCE8427919.1 translation initiation factor IF-6 [Candidatus Methanoperedens sp.]